MKNDNLQNDVRNVRPSRPVRPSIFETVKEVKTQIEYECFFDERLKRVDKLYDELCLIIAEVYVMNPDGVMKISGSEMDICIVQEVYRRLQNEHVELVAGNFKDVTSRVYNKKAYLRTALYNAVFEIDSHYTNLVKHDLGI